MTRKKQIPVPAAPLRRKAPLGYITISINEDGPDLLEFALTGRVVWANLLAFELRTKTHALLDAMVGAKEPKAS